MGTSNFHSMDNFPLVVAEDEYCKRCPECYCSNDEDATECDDCGADLTDVEAEYDDTFMEDMAHEMERYADTISLKLSDCGFFEVSVKSGYYSGIQFYVEENYPDGIDDLTDDECENDFGCSKEEALDMYEKDMAIILDGLEHAKDSIGLIELGVTGRFSNGETLYHRR